MREVTKREIEMILHCLDLIIQFYGSNKEIDFAIQKLEEMKKNPTK